MRVRCHALHCDNVLGDVPGPLVFVSTKGRRPDKPDGRVWIQCGRKDCRTWNVFDPPVRRR